MSADSSNNLRRVLLILAIKALLVLERLPMLFSVVLKVSFFILHGQHRQLAG